MSNEFIVLPDTNERVYEGDIVMLSRFPGLKWIVQYGWYTHESTSSMGWHFCSIPSNTIMPMTEIDLHMMVVVSHHKPHPCPPGPKPHPPGPCPPKPPKPEDLEPFTRHDAELLSRSMLVVDSLAQMEALSDEFLPQGKLVRVNDIDGKGTVEYYEWDTAILGWKLASFGERLVAKEELNSMFSALEKQIADIEHSLEWEGIDDNVQGGKNDGE